MGLKRITGNGVAESDMNIVKALDAAGHQGGGVMVDYDLLLDVLECLIDTADRTTDLENVYNDTTGDCVGWDEVFEVYLQVKDKAGVE